MMRWRALLALAAASAGCREEAQSAADTGAAELFLEVPSAGVRLRLAPGWTPHGGARTSERSEAHRRPEGRAFLVAPRIVLAEEPARQGAGDEEAKTYVESLKGALSTRDGIRLHRTAVTTRPLGGTLARDLEVAYEVRGESGSKGEEVVQRTLAFLRRRAPDGRTHAEGAADLRSIVSVTATYLSRDAGLVGAEVQSMLTGVILSEPGSARGSRASED